MRILSLTPHKGWGQGDSLLGALVRYESYSDAHERCLKIGKVFPSSPALESGFIEEKDFILGTP